MTRLLSRWGVLRSRQHVFVPPELRLWSEGASNWSRRFGDLVAEHHDELHQFSPLNRYNRHWHSSATEANLWHKPILDNEVWNGAKMHPMFFTRNQGVRGRAAAVGHRSVLRNRPEIPIASRG